LVTAENGAVYSYAEGRRQRIVNCSLGQFVDALDVFRPEWEQRATLDDDEAEAQAHRLRSELLRIDERAVMMTDSWWSLVLEQLDQGLL
jgi:hypothetical protein